MATLTKWQEAIFQDGLNNAPQQFFPETISHPFKQKKALKRFRAIKKKTDAFKPGRGTGKPVN